MWLERRDVGPGHVPGRRRVFVSLDGFADAACNVEDAIHDKWKAHIAPTEAIVGVEGAASEYNQTGHRLDKTAAADPVRTQTSITRRF